MQPPRDPPASGAAAPELLRLVDALILFDTPLLDQRFQEAIALHPDPAVREALADLPTRVAEGSRLTRLGGVEWERKTRGGALDDPLRERAVWFILEALLESAEAQIRLKVFLARHAPTQDARACIDGAIAIHRELAAALRRALDALDVTEASSREAPCCVGPQDPEGDLRGQVEETVRGMVGAGKTPRLLVVSGNALRHLRDQGLFQGEEAEVMGVPVQVDFSWPGTHFALLSVDSVPLAEIVSRQA